MLEQVAGRVPVIVSPPPISSSAVLLRRGASSEAAGAAMVMVMQPSIHGATFRVPEKGVPGCCP